MGPFKVLMGPWAHLYPNEGVPAPKADFIGEVVRFWVHHLKGIDTGVMEVRPLRFYFRVSADQYRHPRRGVRVTPSSVLRSGGVKWSGSAPR